MTLKVDRERFEVLVNGRSANLAPKEYNILTALMDANGKVLTRAQLLEKCWADDRGAEFDTRTVDQHIARLRVKLKDNARAIKTVVTRGYRFIKR